MKNTNLTYALILILFCFTSCQTDSTKNDQAQNSDLEDIVETPPEKKVNQAPAPTKVESTSEGKIQSTTGIFANLEQGDYFYLHMKDEKNQETSFNIWQAYEGAAELNVDNWKSVRGKKIKVTWQESTEDIPEAGEKMSIRKVVAVEVLD